MSAREAKRILEEAGFKFTRWGRGSHMIYEKGDNRIVISNTQQLSNGMAAKVRSFGRK